MAVGHYENFPVASLLLPARLRWPVEAVYRFARQADDFADEGERTAEQRLALLEEYRQQLRELQAGGRPGTAFFEMLGEVIGRYRLPFQPFHDLLDAFSQDVVKTRYANFAELLEYCRRSANPVGRLVLHLYEAADDPRNLEWSDSVCSALQLANFWQDVEIDFRKDRIYLPLEDMARYGVSEAQIAARDAGGGWPALMSFEITRGRDLLQTGAPLATRLRGRIGLEVRAIVQGGLRIYEKLQRVDGDVFRRRPMLHTWDWALVLGRALAMRT